MNPSIPMPDQSGDTEQDASGYEKCEQEIEDLETRVAAIEQKLGIQSPADEPDDLQSSIAATKPFGMGSGMSNS
jgi:hypothetical protein